MDADEDMWSSPAERETSHDPHYTAYPVRLKTFADPRDETAKQIARAGFYQFRDNVVCYFCLFEEPLNTFIHAFCGNLTLLTTVHLAYDSSCWEAKGEKEREKMRNSLQARIESFRDHVLENAPTPESIAKAGFYLKFGISQCPFCRLRVLNWPSRENPFAYHAQVSPHCSFVIRYTEDYEEPPLPPRAISLGPFNNSKQPLHPQYALPKDRESSFSNWPGEAISAEEFSKAGFFYTGRGDIVQCFHCGGGLQHWETEDSPMQIHRLYYQDCDFASKPREGVFELPLVKRCAEAPYSTDAVKSESEKLINESTPEVPEAPDVDRMTCAACLSTIRRVIFLPCCHAMCCVKCSKNVSTCPSCRLDICRRAKFFL